METEPPPCRSPRCRCVRLLRPLFWPSWGQLMAASFSSSSPRPRCPCNGPCLLCGPLLTVRRFACRWPHTVRRGQSQVRAHRTLRYSRRAFPGAMSFSPASIATLRPVDRRRAVPAHVTRLHAPEALESAPRERRNLRRWSTYINFVSWSGVPSSLIFLAAVSGQRSHINLRPRGAERMTPKFT